MRENLTSVFERQGKDFATRAYPSLFKFLFLDELLCEKNAFAEMQKNFVALPPSSPVPDPTPTRKRKRKAEPIVAAALSTRKLRSSTSPTNFLDFSRILGYSLLTFLATAATRCATSLGASSDIPKLHFSSLTRSSDSLL